MAMTGFTFDAAGGVSVKRGKEAKVRFRFGAETVDVSAWAQDWSLQAQAKTVDVTPLGYAGEWKLADNTSFSGSMKMIFRTDSEAQFRLLNLFVDIERKGKEDGANIGSLVVDSGLTISVKLFSDAKHYYKATLTIESISTGASVGNSTSFDVGYSIVGTPTFVVIQEPVIEITGSASIVDGATANLTAVVSNAPAGVAYAWESSAPAVATISGTGLIGALTAVDPGTCVITFKILEDSVVIGSKTFNLTVTA